MQIADVFVVQVNVDEGAQFALISIQVTPQIRERLEYELSVIEKTGFLDYFLLVYDVMRFARESATGGRLWASTVKYARELAEAGCPGAASRSFA